MERKIAFLAPGPLHLFWCSGVFYLWYLAKRYQIVLVVTEDYKNNDSFRKICKMPFVEHVEFMSSNSLISRHFFYANNLRKTVEKYRPAVVCQHNACYAENQYLIRWSKKIVPDAIRLYYQPGRMSFMWKDDYKARFASIAEGLLSKWKLPRNFLPLLNAIVLPRAYLAYYVNMVVLPLLLIGKRFHSPVNVNTGKVYRENMGLFENEENDFWLCYLASESSEYNNIGFSCVEVIKHPLVDVGQDVFKTIFGSVQELSQILLLPSYGYTSRLRESGQSEAEVIDIVSSRWGEAIRVLQRIYPKHAVVMKLHPSCRNDRIWQSIQQKLTISFANLIVLSPLDSAEWHAVQSDVVVSDVSTVLWWSILLGQKTVISLDVFDYPGGDEMKIYKEVIYINSLDYDYVQNAIESRATNQGYSEAETLFEFLDAKAVTSHGVAMNDTVVV